jgi:hypothetical protein
VTRARRSWAKRLIFHCNTHCWWVVLAVNLGVMLFKTLNLPRNEINIIIRKVHESLLYVRGRINRQ